MTLTSKDLQHLAKLARLELSEADEASLLPKLSATLDWVNSLQQAPVAGLAPMVHPHDAKATLRADEAQALPAREALMANAPAQAAGYFLVPRVVE